MAKEMDFLDDISLPEKIKPLYTSLAKYVVNLNLKWRFYNELYENENGLAVLSETARVFFISIEQSLRYDMTLAICHLSDQAEFVSKESRKTVTNLSLETLLNRNGNTKDLQELFKEFKKKSKPFRRLRDRLIAHRDLNIILNPQANILPRINKDKVNDVIHVAERILLNISKQYGNTFDISFSVPIVLGGASDLIFWLHQGVEYNENTLRDLKSGHFPEKFGAS